MTRRLEFKQFKFKAHQQQYTIPTLSIYNDFAQGDDVMVYLQNSKFKATITSVHTIPITGIKSFLETDNYLPRVAIRRWSKRAMKWKRGTRPMYYSDVLICLRKQLQTNKHWRGDNTIVAFIELQKLGTQPKPQQPSPYKQQPLNKLTGFTLFGEYYECKSYKHLLVQLTKLLYEWACKNGKDLSLLSTIRGHKQPYWSTQKQNMRQPREVIDGYYVETHFGGKHITKLCYRFLDLYGVNNEHLTIHFG